MQLPGSGRVKAGICGIIIGSGLMYYSLNNLYQKNSIETITQYRVDSVNSVIDDKNYCYTETMRKENDFIYKQSIYAVIGAALFVSGMLIGGTATNYEPAERKPKKWKSYSTLEKRIEVDDTSYDPTKRF